MRPSGFVTDTNLTAFSIVISCFLLLMNEDKLRIGWFKYVFYALSGYSFGLLASRSAMIAVIFGLIALFATKKVERKKIYVMVLIFFLIQLLTPQTLGRIRQLINPQEMEEEIGSSRWILWQAAFRAFESRPAVGLGTGVFFVKSLDFMQQVWEESPNISPEMKEKYRRAEKYRWNPHNIFLTMLSEEGVIGFGIFVTFLIYYFRLLYKRKAIRALIIMGGLLIVSSLSNYAPYYKYYLALCIGLYAAARQDMEIQEGSKD